MKNKPIIYHRYSYEWLIVYTCDTDFSKYSYSPDLSLFKKNSFRDHLNEAVVMITDIQKPKSERYIYKYFQTEKEARAFIKKFIKDVGGKIE